MPPEAPQEKPAAEVIAPVSPPAKAEEIAETDEIAETEEEEEKAPPRPGIFQKLDLPLTFATLVLGVGLLAILQLWSTRELIDHDSLYHVQAAHLLGKTDILTVRKNPWMQATFLRDHYADKEFLFHAFLFPFCFDGRDMDANAKIATIILGALVLLAFTVAVQGAGIRHAWLWILLLLGAGENFTYRLLETRPHLLSIALVLLSIRFIVRRQALPLYFTGYLLAWSYSGPQLLPLLAIVATLARWIKDGQRPAWGPVIGSTVGVVSGMILNPFVPNNLYLWRVQNVDVLARAWGLVPHLARMGPELSPYTTRELLLGSPGFVLALGLAVGALLLARRKASTRTVQLGALSGATLVALLLSAKFMDYAAPLAVLFAASAVDDQWREGRGRPNVRIGLASVFTLVLVGLVVLATAGAHRIVRKYFRDPPQLRGAAGWLASNARGATVIHFDWNDFSTLFHDNPDSYYLFGLDPTFAEVWPPGAKLLEYLEAIRRPVDPKPVSGRFLAEYDGLTPRARFLVVKPYTPEANACLASSLDRVYEDDGGIVFSLGD